MVYCVKFLVEVRWSLVHEFLRLGKPILGVLLRLGEIELTYKETRRQPRS